MFEVISNRLYEDKSGDTSIPAGAHTDGAGGVAHDARRSRDRATTAAKAITATLSFLRCRSFYHERPRSPPGRLAGMALTVLAFARVRGHAAIAPHSAL